MPKELDIDSDTERIIRRHPDLFESTALEEEVLERYGPIFDPANLDNLTVDGFKSFLLIKNNKHWDGIHRHSGAITQDMDVLHDTLRFLLDEMIAIEERLDDICGGGDHAIKGLGKSVITPILLVVYPGKYAVLNSKVKRALEKYGLYPDGAKASFGETYSQVNHIVNEVAARHGVTLFQIDHVFHFLLQGEAEDEPIEELPPSLPEAAFALEKHLEDFLVDNWEHCGLYPEWELMEEDGEVTGKQFGTGEVGTIDILARRATPDGLTDWLVVELKRGTPNDAVVGQVLRYVGWVKHRLASDGEHVEGVIVCQDADTPLRLAVSQVPRVSLKTYRMEFTLVDVDEA